MMIFFGTYHDRIIGRLLLVADSFFCREVSQPKSPEKCLMMNFDSFSLSVRFNYHPTVDCD